ncbi:PH domain-containing protein [Streptomyces sp. cmx-18-6]|uniref:PH domain-containing protein n=1 Tax=Streptomyces sp. cmx-18-6 TaxID=2790930 RepID=UPI00397E94F9
MTSPTPPAEPQYADRIYRSMVGLVCGSLLLVLTVGMAGDALIRGTGRVPWLALAALVTAVPLIVAFSLRPAVFVNDERVRIRNPFRTIQLPWTEVAGVRAAYTSELIANDGTKYQLWAVPVSLRDRKKAARAASRPPRGGRGGGFPLGPGFGSDAPQPTDPTVATGDRTVRELRNLAERAGDPKDDGAGTVTVRWAYEVMAPAVVGAVLLVVLAATG